MSKPKGVYQVALKILLKNSKGETLILKALDNGSYAGFYDIPGGRIDADEFEKDFFDILAREISEEVGDIQYRLDRRPVAMGRHLIRSEFSSSGKEVQIFYVFFSGEYLSGDVKTSDEHSNFEWVDLSKIDLEKYFSSGLLEGVKMSLE